MADSPRKRSKRRGSKLHRTELVTIRLDPKLRYLTELAARKQRRTTSSFIEWAIQTALQEIILGPSSNAEPIKKPDAILKDAEGNMIVFEVKAKLTDMADTLWDPDEPDRIAKLGLLQPGLLSYDEEVLWKLIQECGEVWKGYYDDRGRWRWDVNPNSLDFRRLRELWDTLKAVASGEAEKNAIPQVPDRSLITVENHSRRK